jgi:hypothetical protein
MAKRSCLGESEGHEGRSERPAGGTGNADPPVDGASGSQAQPGDHKPEPTRLALGIFSRGR